MQLRHLQAGEKFRRSPYGKYTYIKTGIKKEEPGCGYYCWNLDGDSEGYFIPGTVEVERIVPVIEPPTTEYPRSGSRRSASEAPFLMCYVQGADSPRKRHEDRGHACSEAERLAKDTRKRVYVLQPIACVTYTPPISNTGMNWERL